jgi:hypothetical protein
LIGPSGGVFTEIFTVVPMAKAIGRDLEQLVEQVL